MKREVCVCSSVFHLPLILNINKLSIISLKFIKRGDSEEIRLMISQCYATITLLC